MDRYSVALVFPGHLLEIPAKLRAISALQDPVLRRLVCTTDKVSVADSFCYQRKRFAKAVFQGYSPIKAALCRVRFAPSDRTRQIN